MSFKVIASASMLTAGLALATPALATHDVPKDGKKFQVSFVRYYPECTVPNTRNSFDVPSCTDTAPVSSLSFGPKGSGTGTGTADTKNGDIKIVATLKDVRGADGNPYNGTLYALIVGRSTDHDCNGQTCTRQDTRTPTEDFQCSNGTCKVKTTVNTLAPGFTKKGNEVNVQVREILIYDPDNKEFLSAGMFVP